MTTKLQQDGNVILHANASGSTITSGSVVKMNNIVGIALVDIADGSSGAVQIRGVFSGVPKVTGNAWTVGSKLVWDVSTSKFDTTAASLATGDVTGCAIVFEAAGSSDTTGVILLTQGNTTVT